MNIFPINRRRFLKHSATAAAAISLAPGISLAADTAVKRTAVDQVTLGKTGIKLSRLGMGCGSNNGQLQTALGREGFNKLVQYAYDQGITYFDCADNYRTFEILGAAIKPLPREKLFIQSKVTGTPDDVLAAIDHHRKTFDTDYVDSMLIHLMTRPGWTQEDSFKRIMDGFNQAVEKKWIRAKGVSCHTLPALRAAVDSDWTEVHLVRVNPQGKHMDDEVTRETWDDASHKIEPVVEQLKKMRQKDRGVIGMKILGNNGFNSGEERDKSIRYAMSRPELNAIVIGFRAQSEIDEAIKRINNALADAA